MTALLLRPGARAVLERNIVWYKRIWMVIIGGFFEPVFYLFAIGVGLGRLVGGIDAGGEEVSYAAWLAPALLAASAMNGAVYESTMNVFFKLRYGKLYEAMLATPVGPEDIAIGEIVWSQVRGALYASAFLAVMAVMGLVTSPLALLAVPGAVLIGFTFGAIGMLVTTYMRSWQHLDAVQLGVLPLFLFSGTFFPLELYPAYLQPVVALSPLYHGVELLRALTLGALGWSLLAHVGFLLVLTAVGLRLSVRRISKLLIV